MAHNIIFIGIDVGALFIDDSSMLETSSNVYKSELSSLSIKISSFSISEVIKLLFISFKSLLFQF